MPETVIRVVLSGPPMGMARARADFRGRRVYTPTKHRHEKTALAMLAAKAMVGLAVFDGPVELRLAAYFAIPVSWPKRRQADALAGRIMPTVKPDWDNIGKLTSDAFNGIVWRDDTQVCRAMVWKAYSADPRIVIEVRPIINRGDRTDVAHTRGSARDSAGPSGYIM